MSLSTEHNYLHKYLLREQISEMRKVANKVLMVLRQNEIEKATKITKKKPLSN